MKVTSLNTYLLLLIAVFPNILTHGQTVKTNRLTLKVEYEKKNKNRSELQMRDTIYINFDYAFNHDQVLIKSNGKSFTSDSLTTNGITGLAGHLHIAKSDLKRGFYFFLNGVLLRRLQLDPRFSSVHVTLDRDEKVLIWRYSRYHFSYL